MSDLDELRTKAQRTRTGPVGPVELSHLYAYIDALEREVVRGHRCRITNIGSVSPHSGCSYPFEKFTHLEPRACAVCRSAVENERKP